MTFFFNRIYTHTYSCSTKFNHLITGPYCICGFSSTTTKILTIAITNTFFSFRISKYIFKSWVSVYRLFKSWIFDIRQGLLQQQPYLQRHISIVVSPLLVRPFQLYEVFEKPHIDNMAPIDFLAVEQILEFGKPDRTQNIVVL